MTDKELLSEFLLSLDNRRKADPNDVSKVVLDWGTNQIEIYRKSRCNVFYLDDILVYLRNEFNKSREGC